MTITRVRLADYTRRKTGRRRDTCTRQRSYNRIWHLYRKHAGRCGIKMGMAHRPFPTRRKCRERPVCRAFCRSLRSFVYHDPFGWIIFNILPNLVVILLIANDMIIIGFLPQFAVKRR